MRRLLPLLLLGAALAGPAAAQDTAPEPARAESLAAARALVETIGVRKQVETMLLRTRASMIAGLRQRAGTLAEPQVAELVDQYIMPEVLAHSGEVVEATVAIYAGRLSVPELRDLAAFYATPLGAKLQTIMPEVFAESLRFGQAWGVRIAQDAFAKHREALRARGLAL
ncbi:DUF2059 domain-containing protein [Paracraurococcus ruber]|uniref:DUF2059 domain-containing protein n=1 Tax=Paracraurococcus ruber TaxID=77675 RepID=A0ABS1CTR0_9PROT|nr:DUF2059 domain-containing protein [Paracraurococcus ruber]MBK1657869.1 hypothetical protein [Paracraurococcus ruber]TDG33550.1 DUF2059 domain-containing protein [Paracraurococcus ruber]